MGDIDYKKAWLHLIGMVQDNIILTERVDPSKCETWKSVSRAMYKIQEASRMNFDLNNVCCPHCACSHVTPILYSCDAEGHIFGQGAWYQTQLIQSQFDLFHLKKKYENLKLTAEVQHDLFYGVGDVKPSKYAKPHKHTKHKKATKQS